MNNETTKSRMLEVVHIISLQQPITLPSPQHDDELMKLPEVLTVMDIVVLL